MDVVSGCPDLLVVTIASRVIVDKVAKSAVPSLVRGCARQQLSGKYRYGTD
ncbi:hypothetical protein Sjap_004341 [Stephania japonica]|uniref:Uncharacterized protein n=1 Tax=Stephania japonica TaxID=461633 RepID=A0AAP0K3L4_9MAGN